MRFRSQSAVLLIDLGQLLSVMRAKRVVFKPIPYYPLIERDLGVIVPSVVQYKKVQQCISGFDPLIKDVALFDVYHGLSEGASYAMRITFGSTDRTLEAREVDEIVEKLKKKLAKTLDVSFR